MATTIPPTMIGLRAELAASIDRTLADEARRNELAIARVRLLTLLGMCGVESWLLSGPTALGAAAVPAAGLTFAYAVGAIGLWARLRRGGWSPGLSWLVPVLDAAYMALRIAFVFVFGGLAHAVAAQELATVTAMAALLAITGAFRLQPRAVVWSTGLATAMYGVFAWVMAMPSFQVTVHGLLIVAIGAISAGMTRIVRRVVQHEVTRLTLRRLLPATVVDAADADPMGLLTEPRSLEATVVVTDLRGFTSWAEHRTPLEVFGMLNEVQGALASAVHEHGGTVDKFMGDGMLAVFGAPRPTRSHADDALRATRAMLIAMRRFPALALGVGVHSGEVVVGCVGSGIRMEFTVLGDTVNTASRLESATKERGVPVLISETTRARARVELAPIGSITLRGRQDPLATWTLAALAPASGPAAVG